MGVGVRGVYVGTRVGETVGADVGLLVGFLVGDPTVVNVSTNDPVEVAFALSVTSPTP